MTSNLKVSIPKQPTKKQRRSNKQASAPPPVPKIPEGHTILQTDEIEIITDKAPIKMDGNFTAGKNFTIERNTKVKGLLTAGENATFKKNLTAGSFCAKDGLVVEGNAKVAKIAKLYGTSIFRNGLNAASVNAENVFVDGKTNIRGSLEADSAALEKGLKAALVKIRKTLKIGRTAKVNNSIISNGDAFFKKHLTAGELEIQGKAIVGGNSKIKGLAQAGAKSKLRGSLKVGSLKLGDDSRIGGRTHIENFAVVGDNVEFAERFTAGSLNAGKGLKAGTIVLTQAGATFDEIKGLETICLTGDTRDIRDLRFNKGLKPEQMITVIMPKGMKCRIYGKLNRQVVKNQIKIIQEGSFLSALRRVFTHIRI